ncbi:MAG TPA: HPr family phosphocarrier protein, partial [Pirellulales bacterium]|nr:HPr family phosphocarrier protein [Pirellulales bacterium]
MAEGTVSRTVEVTNPQGLHARPADMFVKTASRYQSTIE